MAQHPDESDLNTRDAGARDTADRAERESPTNLPGESASFESDRDDDLSGYDDRRRLSPEEQHVDKQLDHGLKETFPASDPVSINPGAD